MNAVVGVDVGGTTIKAAVVDESGAMVYRERRPTGQEHGPAEAVTRVVDLAAELAERAGTPAAVGIAALGLIDEANGVALYSANIGWRDVPMRDLVTARTGGIPVVLGHDIRTPALAEGLFGAGRGVPDFLLLPIGTGIAAAVVTGGRPYSGASGFGGELGHVAAYPDGEQCACGQRGCLETYASAASIQRRYLAAGGTPGLSTPDIIDRAEAGDPVAREVWEKALDALGISIAGYTLLLDPSLVVLGGGLAAAGDRLIRPVAERVEARLAFRPPPRFARSTLGSWAAVLGAAILAWRAAGRDDIGADWSPPTDAWSTEAG